MFKKVKIFFYYISTIIKYKDFNQNMDIYKKKILFDVEKFIQQEDKKRKSKMTADKLAKEVLLFDDCYIIKKEDLEEFITKR